MQNMCLEIFYILVFLILNLYSFILLTNYNGSIEICKLFLEISHLRGSFLILHYVDYCKKDYQHKCSKSSGFELLFCNSQIAKWVLTIAIEQFQMLQKNNAKQFFSYEWKKRNICSAVPLFLYLYILSMCCDINNYLKLVSTIFYQIFIDNPLKTIKKVFYFI